MESPGRRLSKVGTAALDKRPKLKPFSISQVSALIDGMEIPGAGVLRDLQAEVISLRVAAAPGGATSTVAPTGIMTPTQGAGTNLRGQEMEAALTAVNEGLLNSPGFEIGERGGTCKTAWYGHGRAIMHNGTEKGF